MSIFTVPDHFVGFFCPYEFENVTNTNNKINKTFCINGVLWRTTIGLCDVGGFEILPPGTAAQLKNKRTKKVQKMIEKLLPEPKPNSEPMLMGIASAPILQNPLLPAGRLHGYSFSG